LIWITKKRELDQLTYKGKLINWNNSTKKNQTHTYNIIPAVVIFIFANVSIKLNWFCKKKIFLLSEKKNLTKKQARIWAFFRICKTIKLGVFFLSFCIKYVFLNQNLDIFNLFLIKKTLQYIQVYKVFENRPLSPAGDLYFSLEISFFRVPITFSVILSNPFR
jgi:hypothetical protein